MAGTGLGDGQGPGRRELFRRAQQRFPPLFLPQYPTGARRERPAGSCSLLCVPPGGAGEPRRKNLPCHCSHPQPLGCFWDKGNPVLASMTVDCSWDEQQRREGAAMDI